MSILVSGIRLPFDRSEHEAVAHALHQCGLQEEKQVQASVYRCSIDARHGKINKVYSICISGMEDEQAFVQKLQMPAVRYREDRAYAPKIGTTPMRHRPVVIGMGPAGLFSAYMLAKHGYAPVVLERGEPIEARDQAVERFWGSGIFEPQSNIQFGEGGAGAYSDGKLTTRIHDPFCETVLQLLVQFGAPDEILRQAKPHIGTDILKNVVRAIRKEIIALGGAVRFRTQMTGVVVRNHTLAAICADGQDIVCERAILAIGHSARDTFAALQGTVYMEPKAFSVGARIEHLQESIDHMLYGKFAGHPALPPAEYTLSHRADGRACYSFCMCPGGHVVAAQSQPHSIVTNGMSYHARDGKNANAAIVVSVEPADFAAGNDPLSGIAFQRRIEQAAYQATGGYSAPCQCVGDFLERRDSAGAHLVQPTYPRGVTFGNLESCLPAFVCTQMRNGLRVFDRKMHGFAAKDALLTAPETRTSSPVRLKRGEDLSSISLAGLLPCGEGAGYAGGIMSAAVDGIRAAYQIMKAFAPIG